MVLIVLLDDGVSFAGSRPLEAGEVADLRARFGVAPGTLAALLIGKDGGVKRRADEPLDPAAVYAQIDAMPMRRAEIADR